MTRIKDIIDNLNAISETFTANNSLMVYTSGTNNMQIEDRTMSTKEQLNKVAGEMDQLRAKLNQEARMVDGVLLTAYISAFIDAPKVTAPFLSEAWHKERKAEDRYIEMVHKGQIPEGVRVNLTKVSNGSNNTVELTEELMLASVEFADYIEEAYAVPMAKLNFKRHNLDAMQSAERNLEREEAEGIPFLF